MASIVIAGDTSGAVTIAAPATAGTPTLTLPTTSGTLVVTGGAQTIEFAAGSAAAPSITFTGDTNTGIFSPAADSIAFTEGGVESMRITSDGNLLVGGTTSRLRLTIRGSDSSSPTLGTASGSMLVANSASTSEYGMMFGVSSSGDGWIQQQRVDGSATAYNLYLQPAGGNVGVGTNSPSARITTFGATGNSNGIHFRASGWNSIGRIGNNGTVGGELILSNNWNAQSNTVDSSSEGTTYINLNVVNNAILFGVSTTNTVPTERMRIRADGVVSVGNNNGTGEVFAQNTVKVWGAVAAGPGTLYNSFGASSLSKTATGIFQLNFSRTLSSSRFGMAGAGYAASNIIAGGAESTTGTNLRCFTAGGTLTDADFQFLIAGGS